MTLSLGDLLHKDDRSFYSELVQEQAGGLYRFAYRFCGQPDIAEDIVAETYLEAWRGLGSLRKRSSARAWLYKILRRRCLSWLGQKRGRSKEIRLPEDDRGALFEPSAPQQDYLEQMARQEALQNGLDLLDERFREPFLMVFLQGLSCREVAEELKLPLGTVLSRVHRARRFLQKRLAPFDQRSKAACAGALPNEHDVETCAGGRP